MKKILAFLLAIACITACLCLNVNAADVGNRYDLTVASSGNTVTVTVSTDFLCGGVQGMLNYDSSKLEFESVSYNSALASKNGDKNVISSEGKLKFAILGNVSSGTTGEFATFTFTKLVNNAPAKFTVSAEKASSSQGAVISNAEAAVVMYGDCNDNGIIDILDLVRLKKYIAGSSVEINARNADCDGIVGFEAAKELVALKTAILQG